jgi:hypothetical protein
MKENMMIANNNVEEIKSIINKRIS